MKTLLIVVLAVAFTSANPQVKDAVVSVVHNTAVYIAQATDTHQPHKSLFHVNVDVH